ncbi:MAG: hypothetical protein QF554_00860 [Dehalococcoidia bacterium]|jgi:vacuolar-type H+-ATPase subunit E/Vma4|nr:hypothetical protein [Dehalococcoidia bacterium]
MSLEQRLEALESLVASGRVPATSRTLINLERFNAAIEEIRSELPDEMNESRAIIRQKESVIKQAEIEARRIRAYADEEATTIRETAEEKATIAIDTASERAAKMIQQNEVTSEAGRRAEEIIAEAEGRAARIIEDAEAAAAEKAEESESRISMMMNDAEADAGIRRDGADAYASEVLFALEEHVSSVLGKVRAGLDLLENRSPSDTIPTR